MNEDSNSTLLDNINQANRGLNTGIQVSEAYERGDTSLETVNLVPIANTQVEDTSDVSSSQEKVKHWFWDSWTILAFAGTLFFTIQNFAMGGISEQGPKGIVYFNSGALVLCSIYFAMTSSCCNQKTAVTENSAQKRVFILTPEGKINYQVCLWLGIGAVVVYAIFFIVNTTLKLAIMADLNTGIVITIWAINPFTSALMDFLLYKSPLKVHHFIGMVFLIMCAIFVSVSAPPEAKIDTRTPVFEDKPKSTHRIASYIPILCSAMMPIACTFQVAMQKYVTVTIGMSANDFTFATVGIVAITAQISAIIVFATEPGYFEWSLWGVGLLASLGNLIGSFFCTAAIATGASVGPIVALLNCQSIILTIVDSIVKKQLPAPLQLAGLVFGITGAMVLTIPDIMYSIWYRLTRCKAQKKTSFTAPCTPDNEQFKPSKQSSDVSMITDSTKASFPIKQ